MKSILIVTCDFEPSGITSFMISLANYLSKNNDVTVAYQFEGNKKNELNSNIKTIKYSAPSRITLGLALLFTGKIHHLLKLKRSKRTDVSPIASTQSINLIKARLSTVIRTNYDIAISSAEFYCNYYVTYKVSAKKKIGWIHPDYSKLDVDRKIDKLAFDNFDRIVTISDSCKQSFLNVFPEYSPKTLVIENIVDKDRITKMSDCPIACFDEKCLKLVTVCRIDNTSKRLDRIVNAATYLKNKKVDFVWYIVGGGQDELFIKDLVAKNELQQHIIMVGNQDNPYPFIRKADVFVLSSQYEGKPIVITEAIILKCPVIVTHYLSAPEQVDDNTGVIIDNSDESFPYQLFKAIENDLPPLRERIKNHYFTGVPNKNLDVLINEEEDCTCDK